MKKRKTGKIAKRRKRREKKEEKAGRLRPVETPFR